MSKNSSKITIEYLAAITKRGFEEVNKEVNKGFDEVNKRFDAVEASMVTKSYLDDKLADLEGLVIVRQRKEDKKVNLLVEFLQKKNILEKEEVKMLKEIQVFPNRAD